MRFNRDHLRPLRKSEWPKGYDLRDASFDEFVDFFFERNDNDWMTESYSDESFYPVQCVTYYTRLFRQPGFLLARFTQAQLEQGFWAIPSDYFSVTIKSLLWNEVVAWERREECVRAMYFLYRDLFAVDHLVHAPFMWWDQLAFEYCYDLDDRYHPYQKKGETGRQLQQVMFETLCEILKLSCPDCQADAVHGFNHLRHPDTEKVLRAFIEAHPEGDDEWREWVETCIRGEFQ